MTEIKFILPYLELDTTQQGAAAPAMTPVSASSGVPGSGEVPAASLRGLATAATAEAAEWAPRVLARPAVLRYGPRSLEPAPCGGSGRLLPDDGGVIHRPHRGAQSTQRHHVRI